MDWIPNEMLVENWKHVEGVWDLVNLAAWLEFFVYVNLKFVLREDFLIILPELENGAIIWSHVMAFFSWNGGPLVIIKLKVEYVAIEQICNFNTFINKYLKIILKQVRWDPIILKLNQVLDYMLNGSDLIIS